ncbi:MAG TPA: CSLREA domain-containing protein [Rudaea sp.]|nr:CSLREA domain-containing protein [Rudaea sp.]
MSTGSGRLFLFTVAAALASPTYASIVDTTSDADDGGDGVCSLREAIIASNNGADHHECLGADGGINSVSFEIQPNDGEVKQIALTSALPNITHSIGFDGSPQAGTSCQPVPGVRVQIINPNNLTTDGLVLDTGSDYSSIGSIGVSGFNGSGAAGIRINSSHVQIGCVTIGTDVAGAVAQPNYHGIFVNGDQTWIGLVDAGSWLPNLISGNSFSNIRIAPGVSGTLITGNYIGVDITGLTPLSSGYGIYDQGTGTHIGTGFTSGLPERQRNIIGVNMYPNVTVDIELQSATGTIISGNYIGVGADGHTALPNLGSRIGINDSTGVLIGCDGNSSWDGCRNVIANTVAGSSIANFAGSPGNAVVSNFIGVAADGVSALTGFSSTGITVASDTLVARNVITTGNRGIALENDPPGTAAAIFLNGAAAGSSGAILDSTDNCVQGNANGGVVLLSGTATATTFANNWWGAADGPAPGGSGDSVAANVTATPFLDGSSVYCGFDDIFGNGFD